CLFFSVRLTGWSVFSVPRLGKLRFLVVYGALLSNFVDPAILDRVLRNAPCRRPALRWQCPDALLLSALSGLQLTERDICLAFTSLKTGAFVYRFRTRPSQGRKTGSIPVRATMRGG